MDTIDWKNDHILYIANEIPEGSESPDEKQLRSKIEPWLTAVFQSEHLSLLIGTGLTTAICVEAEVNPQAMQRIEFITEKDKIKNYADTEAQKIDRGGANFEDNLRTAIEALRKQSK